MMFDKFINLTETQKKDLQVLIESFHFKELLSISKADEAKELEGKIKDLYERKNNESKNKQKNMEVLLKQSIADLQQEEEKLEELEKQKQKKEKDLKAI